MSQSIPLQDINRDGELRRTPHSSGLRKSAGPGAAKAAGARSGLLRSAVEALQPSVKTAHSGGGTERQIPPAEAEAAARLVLEVRKAQQGDAAAMTALIESNRPWVRGIAYGVLGDAHLAEDAAQEVCVRVLKHLRGLDTPEAFRPWMYRMTRNVALSMAQRRERIPQPMSMDVEHLQESCRSTRMEMPGASLEADERVSSILDTIGRLPEIYREVLIFKHVQDLSYAEMSEILGVSVKSLEVRLVRARKLLQERLGRRFNRGRKRDPRDDKS